MKIFSTKICALLTLTIFLFTTPACVPRKDFVEKPSYPGNSAVKPIFNATDLAGRTPTEVSKILGKPKDERASGDAHSSYIQEYTLGEDTTVEFYNNKVSSVVIFFNQKNVDRDTAYALVGLSNSNIKPIGITDITTGDNWIKIKY